MCATEMGSRGWSLLARILLVAYIVTHTAATGDGQLRRQATPAAATGIGVNYGMEADNLPPPAQVAALIQATIIDSVKIYSADPEVLQAFAHTNISLIATVPDEQISILAASSAAATAWVQSNIIPFYPATNIVALAVGNEILTTSPSLLDDLLPAIINLHSALHSLRLHRIKISTAHSMAVLATSYPPSASTFQPQLLPVLTPLFSFLTRTNSFFMSNTYPFFAYKQNPDLISLDYALFRPNTGVTDSNSGLQYTNLFDAQVDAIYYAMNAAGFDDIPVVVAESGWPSAGDPGETGAGLQNAQEYNSNLIKHIVSGVGTPYKPNRVIETYIFALFNEDLKPGPTSERNFGLFHPDKTSVYDVGLLKSSSQQPPVPSNTPSNGTPNAREPESTSSRWCVANPRRPETILQQCLDYACEQGGADCEAIQEGGSCFNPNTLLSHASYAMNSYYQQHGRNSWNCYFGGAGIITSTNPSYGSCIYVSN